MPRNNAVTPASVAIGQAIREQRQARKLSVTELAGRVGVTQPTVTNWEIGARSPAVSDLPRIASALGLPPTVLARRIFEKLDGIA